MGGTVYCDISIHNGIQKIGGCDYLILAGLDEKQKSYLTFLDKYDIIEIESIDDVETYLGGIAYDKDDFLSVRLEETSMGLLIAGRENLKLSIDNTADYLTNKLNYNSGLIVVENDETTSMVSAINYALSIDLDVQLINPLPESEAKGIKLLIEDWQDGNNSSYQELYAKMFSRLDGIEFTDYEFVTFFTNGAPYSLILKNELPISYVHLNHYPNLFIVDNIYFERRESIGSSIVFSPLEFGDDEETNYVIKAFQNNNFWVKELLGKNASTYNIDMNVKEYPYDVLHICSHGGEVNGYTVVEEFVDQDGNKHVVEYDDVLSLMPVRGEGLIQMEHKCIWRKFDGFNWKSKELEEQNYPHYVYSDMLNAIVAKRNLKEKYKRKRKDIVPDSCAIKCSDFIYQAIFNMVACFHRSPIIFNNTCWSWSGISESFLDSGARGYIGTLWEVENNVAKEVAENFYKHIFDDTVINVLHSASKKTKGTDSEDIYIYWGLHFSTLKKADSVATSRKNITECLLLAFYRWRERSRILTEGTTRDNALGLAKWDYYEMLDNFRVETLEIIRKRSPTKGV